MSRELRPVTCLLAAAFALLFLPGPVAGSDREEGKPPPTGEERRVASRDTTPEAIWKGFVEHLESLGREDLLPRQEEPAGDIFGSDGGAEAEEPASREDQEHHEDHDPARPLLVPGAGDPIFPILLRISPELVRLQALFPTEEESALGGGEPVAERAARVRTLLEKIDAGRDPWVRAYARLFEARLAVDSERPREAIPILRKLLRSPHFLSRREAHRQLARAYRGIGDDTLALLELRLFLLELAREDFVDRRWAEKQLEEIRAHHEGPLRESVKGAESASVLISSRSAGETTREQQKRIEEILEKAIQLFGEDPTRPCCEEAARSGSCKLCGEHTGKVTLSEQQRVEEILVGIIEVLEKTCPHCKSGNASSRCSSCGSNSKCNSCGACKACGAGSGQGQGVARGKGKEGNPEGAKPNDNPARDTRLRKGQATPAVLKDREFADPEVWGKINDREVARSLSELWGKIPVAYRRIVAQYYRDITELEESAEKKEAGK